MNKTEIIDIELPVMAGLAKLALFGEVQKMFNLYPGQLAEFFIETAKKEHSDPVNAAKIGQGSSSSFNRESCQRQPDRSAFDKVFQS